MREIKFRVKQKDLKTEETSKEWSYYTLGDFASKSQDIGSFFDGNTWGQYTGLKDRNGKECWEGDIVRYTFLGTRPEDEILILPVIFHEGVYALATINNEPLTLREAIKSSNKASGLEIIGNIYENSDLLNK